MSKSGELSPMAPGDRPRLALGVKFRRDPVDGQPVLLFPEGMVKLNNTGVAILELCDGKRSLEAIAAELARRFRAPLDAIQQDVTAYVHGLREQNLIEVATGAEEI